METLANLLHLLSLNVRGNLGTPSSKGFHGKLHKNKGYVNSTRGLMIKKLAADNTL